MNPPLAPTSAERPADGTLRQLCPAYRHGAMHLRPQFPLRHDLQPAHHAADIPRGIPLETVAPETRGRR